MIKFDVFGQLSVEKRLQLMTMPAPKRRRIISGIGREIKRSAIRNIRNQRNVDGTPWKERADGSGRKMMLGMRRRIYYTVSHASTEISFKGKAKYIAREQQDGSRTIMTAGMASSRAKDTHYEKPATRKQAKALREVGYKIRRKGTKGWKKPSLKWIENNMKVGQAGLILRTLRNEPSKTQWEIVLPPRSFLGLSEVEVKDMVNRIFDSTINQRV